jgi:hypothetical protein
MVDVRVLGAGPAGSAAALAALDHGARVEIFEKTPFPRHKVCGEFLSPESGALLQRLGVWNQVERMRPARLTRLKLTFGSRESSSLLSEPAWGFSRYALDRLLLDHAVSCGATLQRVKGEPQLNGPTVIATGRNLSAPKGRRLFGFKAHFDGAANDTMELYFTTGLAYVGFNAIEDGMTNVCGLAGEDQLSRTGFDIDAFLEGYPIVRQRINGLRRKWKWLIVGPLVFDEWSFADNRSLGTGVQYRAGDDLSFVDPFAGSGILSALTTGMMAGAGAARGVGIIDYNLSCKAALRRQLLMARLFRRALAGGWGYSVGRWLPAQWLFHLTRPNVPYIFDSK